jgi:hypothetical protein
MLAMPYDGRTIRGGIAGKAPDHPPAAIRQHHRSVP